MFGWLKRKKKSEGPWAPEVVKGWQEERVKLALDVGRVERDRKARDVAREAKQNAVNISAARDARTQVDVTEQPGILAEVIAERGGGGRVGPSPEQIELEDTVKDLLHPPKLHGRGVSNDGTIVDGVPVVNPEPADRIETTEIDPTTFRTKIALLFIRFACWLMGKPIGKTATSLTILPPPSKHVAGSPGFGHSHVHDFPDAEEEKTDINRFATGRENGRLEESRDEVLKIQSERAAALHNEPVRKQLAVREQEENPEQYLKGVGQIDVDNIQATALISPTMSEEIDNQNAWATQEEKDIRDSWVGKGVHPEAFNAGAEEDLRKARAAPPGRPLGAQGTQGDRKDV